MTNEDKEAVMNGQVDGIDPEVDESEFEELDIDALVSATGNVPGEMLNAIFLALMPFRLTHKKYIDLLDDIDHLRSAHVSTLRLADESKSLCCSLWGQDAPSCR